LLRRANVGTRLAASLIAISLAAVALALLVTGPLAPFVSRDLDAPGSSFFLAQTPAAASLYRAVGALGNPAVAASILIACCTTIGLRTHTWVPFWAGTAALLGAVVITSVVRAAASRSANYGPVEGFPSGHVMTATSVFGTLALLAAVSALPRCLKRLLGALAIAVPAAVAWSRLAILDHVPSDVIGGVLLGAAWAASVVLAIRAPRDRREGVGASVP
jgi:undecaprenyl-diphosphatase